MSRNRGALSGPVPIFGRPISDEILVCFDHAERSGGERQAGRASVPKRSQQSNTDQQKSFRPPPPLVADLSGLLRLWDYLWGPAQLLRMQGGQGARARPGRRAAVFAIEVCPDETVHSACPMQPCAPALLNASRRTHRFVCHTSCVSAEPRRAGGAPLLQLRRRSLAADSISQVQHPIPLDDGVRVLEQMLGIHRPEVPLA